MVVDEEKIEKMGLKVVKANLMSTKDYLRHEPDKLTRAIMRIFMEVKGRGE